MATIRLNRIKKTDLLSGDILIFSKKSTIGRIIQIFRRSIFNHTARYMDENSVWEAIAGGYKERTLIQSIGNDTIRIIVKRQRIKPNIRLMKLDLEYMRNVPYEFSGLIASIYRIYNGLWIGDKEIKKSTFCSKADAYLCMRQGILYYKDKWYMIAPDELALDFIDFETFELDLSTI